MRRGTWSAAFLALAVVAAACSASGSGDDDGRLNVVTTVSPITNIVQNIGGTRLDVTGIVPEGTNSHTFEPAPSDARAFADADVVFINGLHLEEPTKDLAQANVGDGEEQQGGDPFLHGGILRSDPGRDILSACCIVLQQRPYAVRTAGTPRSVRRRPATP